MQCNYLGISRSPHKATSHNRLWAARRAPCVLQRHSGVRSADVFGLMCNKARGLPHTRTGLVPGASLSCRAAGAGPQGVPGASSPEERRNSLDKLIKEAATERQVSDEDVSLLDEEELGVLVKKKWTTKTRLLRTTVDRLVAAGISEGAAELLKDLFPGPITEGVVAVRSLALSARINSEFARQIFAPFPKGAVPRELEAAHLQHLLLTPLQATVSDRDELLLHHKALDMLLASCITTNAGTNAGSAAAVSLTHLQSCEVYHCLQRACEAPLRSEAASPGAWQQWWGQLVESVVRIAAEHAAAPITSDIAITEQTLSMDANSRDVVVWLQGVPFLCCNVWPTQQDMQLAQLEAWLQTSHHGASPAVYGHLGWVLYLLAAGSRVQFFCMPSDQDGYSTPLTDVLDMREPAARAALVLALINIVRMARSINAECWLPNHAATGTKIWVPRRRPSPYPVPDEAAAMRNGWTPYEVTVTVGRRYVLKEYLAPGWALTDNLPLYRCIMDQLVPNTVKVHKLMVEDVEYDPDRPYAPDSWFRVSIKMSPSAAQFTPRTAPELFSMVQAVLELLQELHQLGYNHRDIRLANMFYSGGGWLLSDWELGGHANRPIPYNIKRLPDGFQRNKTLYTNDTDLWQTAEMIREVLAMQRGVLKCPAAEPFAKLLQKPGTTAAIALQQLKREMW